MKILLFSLAVCISYTTAWAQATTYGGGAGGGITSSYFGHESGWISNNYSHRNTFIGYRSGYKNKWHDDNTYVGYYSGNQTQGFRNTFIGGKSGTNLTGGSDNIFIGYESGPIGAVSKSNELYIDNEPNNSPLIWGDFNTDDLVFNSDYVRISSGTSEDAVLSIEADTDNNNELDNARIQLRQDGGLTGAYFGFYSEEGGDNLLRIGTRYSGIDNWDAIVINPNNDNVGIGTSSASSNLTIYGSYADGWESGIELNREGGGQGKIVVDNDGMKLRTTVANDNFYFRNSANSTTFFIGSTGNVGIGTTSTGSHKLAVEGSIGAREIRVEIGAWSDFVFEEGYQLPKLSEVKAHIKENGHLKDIPGEAEVKANGINLGEMDAKLLQKIEELTLYIIDLQKQIDELKKQTKNK